MSFASHHQALRCCGSPGVGNEGAQLGESDAIEANAKPSPSPLIPKRLVVRGHERVDIYRDTLENNGAAIGWKGGKDPVPHAKVRSGEVAAFDNLWECQREASDR
jgi:hypothetical protein